MSDVGWIDSLYELFLDVIARWWLWLGLIPLGQLAFLYSWARPWLIRSWPWFAKRVKNRPQRRVARRQDQRRWPLLLLLSASGFFAALLATIVVVFHDTRRNHQLELADALELVRSRDAAIKLREDEITALKLDKEQALAAKQQQLESLSRELGALQQQLDDRTERQEARGLLGKILKSGGELLRRNVSSQAEFDKLQTDADAWYAGAIDSIRSELSEADAQFFADTSGHFSRTFQETFSDEHNSLKNGILARNNNLKQMLEKHR